MTPALTTQQLATLKASIAANAANVLINGQATAISAVPVSPDNAQAVADWYNQTAAGPHVVWRDLPMETVLGLVVNANMTPIDAIPTDTAAADYLQRNALWQARSLACQGKVLNLQALTAGRTTAPMKRAGFRAGLQDCLTNVPAGASGATLSAGWTGVRDAAKFSATNAEKLFANGTGSTGSPADLSAEGQLTGGEVLAAMTS